MEIWKNTRNLSDKNHIEISVTELQLRLQTILQLGDIEIVQLALQSLLDEVDDCPLAEGE